MYCSSGVLANRSSGVVAALQRRSLDVATTPLEGKFFGLQNQVKTVKLWKKNHAPRRTNRCA